MDSIEGAYIGISRFLITHPGTSGWFPLWYGGIPFQNTYPPLLHILVAFVAWAFRISPALSHHAVTGLLYCLGPVALFVLCCWLSGNWKASFVASLLFSLTSPSALLVRPIRLDLGSAWFPRRLQTLVVYGEGPHIASITLLLFAILAFHLAVDKKTPLRMAAAAVAFAAVVSTNWLGTFALVLAVISYLLARWSEDPRVVRTLAISAVAGILGYCLILPWFPPSTIRDIQRNAQFVGGNYQMGPRQAGLALLLILAVVLARWVLTKLRVPLALRFGIYFLVLTGGITLPAEWFHIYVVPQPERYHLEMEAAIAIVVAFGASLLLRHKRGEVYVGVAVLLAIFTLIQFRTTRRYARAVIRSIDIHQTVEYQVGNWLQQNLPGSRVFADGSVELWLSAFSDTPQVGGGFGQGIANPEIPVMTYGIPYMAGDGPDAAMWLRVLGCQAVVVSEQTGRDAYNENWKDPQKFRGVLPELWRNGGDVIYGVPQRSHSLAHVILPADVIQRAPDNMKDLEAARRLDAALEDASRPTASAHWLGQNDIYISSALTPDQVVFVQATYHPGWHATVNSMPQRITRDGLGFMILEPHCSGPCEIRLTYDGGIEMRLAEFARAAALIFLTLYIAYGLWRRKAAF